MTEISHRDQVLGSAFRVLVMLEALSFLVFAVLHLGVRIPLGFAVISTDTIDDAVIAEGLSGAFLALSAAALFTRRRWALRATVFAQAFSLAAVLVGIAAIAAGLGPSSLENDVYHRVMAPVLALSLVWLATPSGRGALQLSGEDATLRR
ncbi:MAG TPA: hypothetical protein VF995_03540 [Actinomycetota bacterium]